jgi:putative transcriptional regulator
VLRPVAWLLAALLALPASAHGAEAGAILLVARRDLPDPFFRDSVVLVTNAGVAPLGVIINKPLELTLEKAMPDREPLRSRPEKIFFGGPVKMDEVVFVFRAAKAPEDAMRVMEGVYLSAKRGILDSLLAREQPLEGLRIFAGHAGWAAGQLENEIARGDWQILPADGASIFAAKPEALWPELRRRASAVKAQWPARSFHFGSSTMLLGFNPFCLSASMLPTTFSVLRSTMVTEPSLIPGRFSSAFCTKA